MSSYDEISDEDVMTAVNNALDEAVTGRSIGPVIEQDDTVTGHNQEVTANILPHNFFTNENGECKDAETMVISPDFPYHLLDPSEDVDELEEEEAMGEEEEQDQAGSADGKVYTDSLSEMCLCVCKVCSTKMKFNSLREHVRIQHNLRMSQYKAQYGKIAYSRMTYHKCKGCGKVLRAIYATIKKHLQTVHSQSFKQYATQYNIFKGRFDKKEEICMENKTFSDDPTKMCMTVCRVCNTSLEPYNMKNHVKGKHFLSMLEYKTNFGDIEFISEVFHRCKVCDKSVLFEYQKLSNHLFFNHGIGIAKYKDFLQGKMSISDLQQQADPHQSPRSKDDQPSNKAKDRVKKQRSRTQKTDLYHHHHQQRPATLSHQQRLPTSAANSASATASAAAAAGSSRSPFFSQQNFSLALMQSLQQNPLMLQNVLLMQQMALMGPDLVQKMALMSPELMQQMALSSPEVMQAMALMGPEAFNTLLRGQNKSSNSDIQVSLMRMRSTQALNSLLSPKESLAAKEAVLLNKQTPVQDQ